MTDEKTLLLPGDPGFAELDPTPTEEAPPPRVLSRRAALRLGALGIGGVALAGAGATLGPSLADRGLLSSDGLFSAAAAGLTDLVYLEVFPTSPLVLKPFNDELPVPKPARPESRSEYSGWAKPPGPGDGQQNSLGNERHQKWCSDVGYADPVVYKFDLRVAPHTFTTSDVLPIDKNGRPIVSYDADGKTYAAGTTRKLPPSTIYGFNGTFPGPMINAEYGKPVLVRFENHLDENPYGLDRQDFGTKDLSFLTHLHNGHTAPESDGNPHYAMRNGPKHEGYRPGMFCDNLYLNWPAGGDSREKQSFFWFHDHRMDQTGSNVYKGLVGLYPIYDPEGGLDMGDERQGLRLPGVRKDNSDGSFEVDYDIPLAFSDFRFDDGVTTHKDIHDGEGDFPAAGNPKTHPEWWGKTFYKHFPNHGFVGDVFTVNGTAYPVMEVKRRKYRFRFLDASISRIYDFTLMSSTQGPKSAVSLGYGGDELQGQYRIPDGQQCMQFTQIASDGGLLPFAVKRDNFELWPAKRREMIIDFTRYVDGSPTKKGDVIYLTNTMKMPDGRMWTASKRFSPDPRYKVPVIKFVIGDDAADDSVVPPSNQPLRALPPLPTNWKTLLDNRLVFEVQRGSTIGETEWLVNGRPFDPAAPATSLKNPAGKTPLAQQKVNSFALWEIRNGGGGWVHPFHLHMEEHRTVMRNGKDVTGGGGTAHPDDVSREDLIALDPSESVIVYRGFRDFTGQYVAHCHNLAHEDHSMMFGWEITP
ncbi:multicopper oxidase family protein [Microlunatus flavus]|uniref:Multicopper oxidase with three cupredoxin domains (Includes cell division protein FtsP and spore coat protein CotA) n=1 Tax=Microlunatus flavus TaxID=1036181 RepID=A0A1H9G9F5_9ACTN|nr:multicopper oxidase domain-containing protein [Microlunatus flavus]SEQ46785.1 Multicopper oxidase with three cupredoxin domains (includes cell division protein FtsP and spore coat protein CotA) [Microlunatus flavus]